MGGARRPPITIFTITYKVAVYAPAERAGTLPLIHLYPYVLCRVDLEIPREHRVHIRVVLYIRGKGAIWEVYLPERC